MGHEGKRKNGPAGAASLFRRLQVCPGPIRGALTQVSDAPDDLRTRARPPAGQPGRYAAPMADQTDPNTTTPGDWPARIAHAGLLAGPLLAVLSYWVLPEHEALSDAGRLTAAIGIWMAVWWMSEAVPLPATALLPVVLFPLSGIQDSAQTLRPYASDIIFLFMGGFVIGLGMQRWGLHTRIGLAIVRRVGTSPVRLVAGFMAATALLSMWISNTAAAMMMLPVGLSVIGLIDDRTATADPAAASARRNFATCLMLGIAYGASIGGLGTLIGSPPNLILASYARDQLGLDITMLGWMALGVPLVVLLLPLTWLWLVRVAFPVRMDLPGPVQERIRQDLGRRPPMSRGERIVLVVFLLTAAGWVLRQPLSDWLALPHLTDATIAMTGALLLFVLPVSLERRLFAMDWETAARLPWGILLLFGGGLSLASAISRHGVDTWLASGFGGMAGAPALLVLLAVTTLVIFMTELTSNTAVANTLIPVMAAVALGLGQPPLPLILAVALAASCAFMLPVATPPNAIVYASGHVTIAQMVRAGLALNLLAVGVIALVIRLLLPWMS
ncbi:MAG: SLC13 family permease [Burkholderiales bacterium]|nr:MAG: SLC13 family permease [Burkholderiales bacterium]